MKYWRVKMWMFCLVSALVLLSGVLCDCPPENGYCVKSNGWDQNRGVHKLNSINGNTKQAQESCLQMCKRYSGATGCEVIWNRWNRGCYVHTLSIARGNGRSHHTCWVFSKCRTTAVNVNPNCPPENGFCLKPNGWDQNHGVHKLNSINGNTKQAQESCLQMCKRYSGATGCEVIWNRWNRGCYVHTLSIARGNGRSHHTCWVFSKCRTTAVNVHPRGITTLFSSETLGYWGQWGAQQTCPRGQYAYGFQLKSEKWQHNRDDSALNGIKLLCNGGNDITSSTERWGGWLASRQCKAMEPVTGFQIQIETPQGHRDDTAANNVNLLCKGGYSIEGVAKTKWGSWSRWLRCPRGKAVVGIQTRVEKSCGRCDDSALNGVKLLCGDYKSEYISLGCWKEKRQRAVPNLDGSDSRIRGNYARRSDAIHKCYAVAKERGMLLFAIQNGGFCSAANNFDGFRQYGKSNRCQGGKGGPWANSVYKILGVSTSIRYPGTATIRTWFRKFMGSYRLTFGHYHLQAQFNGEWITLNGHRIKLVFSSNVQFPAIAGWFKFSFAGYWYFLNVVNFKVVRFSATHSACRNTYKGLPNYCGTGTLTKLNPVAVKLPLMLLSGLPTLITKTQLLTTITSLPKQYDISFDFKPTEFIKRYSNILHMTTGGNAGWERSIPAVFRYGSNVGIANAIKGHSSWVWARELVLNKWVHFRLSQKLEDGRYVYRVYMNRKLLKAMTNSKPEEFKKVQIWISDKHYKAQPGYIMNLSVTGVKSCDRACTRIHQPVCDTTGQTHANECIFAIAKCKNPKLKMSYTGGCRKVLPTRSTCLRPCTRIYDPVCDNLGQTHGNRCTFALARCRNPKLEVVFGGRCEDAAHSNTHTEGSVTYVDVKKGTCSSVTKEDCGKIAASRGLELHEIANLVASFPPGCYHRRLKGVGRVYYNPKKSKASCTQVRACICKPGTQVIVDDQVSSLDGDFQLLL